MKVLRRVVDIFCQFLVSSRVSVLVGNGTLVNWWALRSLRGGTLRIGSNSIVRCHVAFDSVTGRVEIGDRCFIGASHLICHTAITLKDDVIVSWGVTIVDHDSHALELEHRRHDVTDWARGKKNWLHVKVSPVTIESGVWIGFDVSVLKGVTIGTGSVIAANSVVTRDVPPYTVVAGNPARVIRRLHAGTDTE